MSSLSVPSGPSDVRPEFAGKAEDRNRLFLAKSTRAVAYGALSGFLFLYLQIDLGISVFASLALTSFTLVGAAAWSLLAVGPFESRLGRRRSLSLFAGLFTLSAVILLVSANPVFDLVAILLGGVAASSADNGPLASLDQAILPGTVGRKRRTATFGYYNLLGSFAAAAGALLLTVPGALSPRAVPFLPPAPHPWILFVYLALAAMTWVAYLGVSSAVEVEPGPERRGKRATEPLSPPTRSVLRELSALFAVDSFAGGLIINPLVAAYFVLVWHADAVAIGIILFLTGVVTAISYLVATWLAERFGLLRTIVFTHLPSSVLLVAVPFMPSYLLAVGVWIVRSSLSQMDVPTRQAYVMELVSRRERVRVAGTLSGVRAVGQAAAPIPAAAAEAGGFLALPFVVAGVMKAAYDLALWFRFRSVPMARTAEVEPGT